MCDLNIYLMVIQGNFFSVEHECNLENFCGGCIRQHEAYLMQTQCFYEACLNTFEAYLKHTYYYLF